MLTFKDELKDEEAKRLPSFLKDVCDVQMVLYHSSRFALLQMEVESYTLLGNKILEGNGYKTQGLIVTHLEGKKLTKILCPQV